MKTILAVALGVAVMAGAGSASIFADGQSPARVVRSGHETQKMARHEGPQDVNHYQISRVDAEHDTETHKPA